MTAKEQQAFEQEVPLTSRVRIVAQAAWWANGFKEPRPYRVYRDDVRLWVTEDGAAYYGRSKERDVWRLPDRRLKEHPDLTLRGCARDISHLAQGQLSADVADAWLKRSEAFALGARGWSGDPAVPSSLHLPWVPIPEGPEGTRNQYDFAPWGLWTWEEKLLGVPLGEPFRLYMASHDPWPGFRPEGARPPAIPGNSGNDTKPPVAPSPSDLQNRIERLSQGIIKKGHGNDIARAEARRFAIEAQMAIGGLTGQDALRTIDKLGKAAMRRLAHHLF